MYHVLLCAYAVDSEGRWGLVKLVEQLFLRLLCLGMNVGILFSLW